MQQSAKTALVTGASRGIGRAIAYQLAFCGFNIALGYHKSEVEALSAAKELSVMGVSVLPFCCDVSDSTAVAKAVNSVEEQLGGINLLVCNAGIAGQKLFTDITPEEWNHMFAVNVNGVYHFCHAVLPGMIRRHSGKIITISSIWGLTGASCEVHYSATKAAIIGMTKALAKEVGPSGIQVNCVAPGVIDTDMNGALDPEALHTLREETPLGRIGTPEDVANCVAFLAGAGGDFITGQVLSPNGGFVI